MKEEDKQMMASILCFNFPPLICPDIDNLEQYFQEIEEVKFPNYISMIDDTLDSYKGGGVLKELRVDMPCLDGANIERWIEFALAREVEIIDIQMFYVMNTRPGHYTLELSNLIRRNDGQSLPGLRSLREFSLSNIQVGDGEIELLLSNFPNLESLSIARSERLKRVSVFGHSLPKLKHLEISHAWNIESIEVCDLINLVSLSCHQLSSTYVLRLNNVPKLAELYVSDGEGNTLAELLPQIPSSIHDQLRLLKLYTWTRLIRVDLPTYKLPDLINIKRLELEVPMRSNTFQLFPLIEACRSLEEVEIKFLWSYCLTTSDDRKILKHSPKKKLSPNLKKLKLSGYFGCTSELEFALFIINNVVALEELIVKPCEATTEIRENATARAWQHFQPITPDSVKLVIV